MRKTEKSPQVSDPDAPDDPESRVPPLLAVLAVSGLYFAIPERLMIGPRWLLVTVVLALLIPALIAHKRENIVVNRVLGYALSGVITAFMIISLALLVHYLPTQRERPGELLRSAAALWVTNILVFASWYWRLDAGGPHERDLRAGHLSGSFLFPQMTFDEEKRAQMGTEDWSPHFLDYLFLAFNTSTALSPADTGVLSRWAKALMMIQATISLIVIALLAGRAVNILGS